MLKTFSVCGRQEMHRDFKSGLALGLLIVAAGALWLASRSSVVRKRLCSSSRNSEHGAQKPAVSVRDSWAIRPAQRSERVAIRDPNGIDWTAYEQDEKIRTERFHIVGRGETLSDVAGRYYGSPTKWQKIYDANRDVITDPDKVRPGTKLIIPD